jgi:hypothetical protein
MKQKKSPFKNPALIIIAAAVLLVAVITVIISLTTGSTLSASLIALFSRIGKFVQVLLVFDIKFYLIVAAVLVCLFIIDLYKKKRR